MVTIEELPDYAALQQVERALWKQGKTRGAAVLVGSGFSRNAELLHDGGVPPPLWTDLSQEMQRRLYPAASEWKDPLRLAEEFRTVLGEPALEGLIREMVTDEEWLPGLLHKQLVQLPWVDILTTNWDTLLERAAQSILGTTYEPVRCLEDVATTRAPRIVKLHGSLPSNRPFIFSEEDYRTYPRLFAPFVNLVQQVLLENELCLVGFSGDDPNFLAWTGWIRDQLGSSARQMYLVGALNVSPAQRRLLERRNISVIDLQPLINPNVVEDKHRVAMEMFLQHLASAKPRAPWVWPKSKPMEHRAYEPDVLKQAGFLRLLTERWSQDRTDYPGWAVCPEDVRAALKNSTISYPQLNKSAFQQLERGEQASLVVELLWRLDVALLSIPEWLQDEAEQLLRDPESCANQQRRRIALMFLIKRARETGRSSFPELLNTLQSEEDLDSESRATIAYETCLKALQDFNFEELEKQASAVTGTEPLWGLRRGALLCALGKFDEAKASAERVLADMYGKFYRNRSSLWVLSRLAWAEFCWKQYSVPWGEPSKVAFDEFDSLQAHIHETRCDPWDTFQGIERRTEEAGISYDDQTKTTSNTFDPGIYRDHSRAIRLGGWSEAPLIIWQRLADHVGIPLRVNNLNVLVSRMERAERLNEPESIEDFSQVVRLIQAGGEATLDRRFGRITVALLAPDVHAFLMQTLIRAFDFAVLRMANEHGVMGGFWSGHAAAYMEVLSRLVVRATPEQALAVWDKGSTFAHAQQCRAKELFEPLNNLMQRSASAIPPSQKQALIAQALDFPLPDEKGISGHFASDWPIAAQWLPKEAVERPSPDDDFALRVRTLIDKVSISEKETRSRAALWLRLLHAAGALTHEEGVLFGEALWARREPEDGFPADTMLRPFVYLSLPGHPLESIVAMLKQQSKHINAAEYFISIAQATHKAMLKQQSKHINAAEYFISIAQATHKEETDVTAFYKPTEALECLENVLLWEPAAPPLFDFSGVENENRRTSESLGAYVANAIMPVLRRPDLDTALLEKLLQKEASVPSLVQTYPQLLRLAPELEAPIVKAILKAMVSRESNRSRAGFNALYRFIELTKVGVFPAIPSRLIDGLSAVIETRREPGLLHALNVAAYLLQAKLLDKPNQERIGAVLDVINAETVYTLIPKSSGEERTLTLLRASAVKIAARLKTAGTANQDIDQLLIAARIDPMPEVRFAVESELD